MATEQPPQLVISALLNGESQGYEGPMPFHFNVITWARPIRPLGIRAVVDAARSIADDLAPFPIVGQEEVNLGENGRTRSMKVGPSGGLEIIHSFVHRGLFGELPMLRDVNPEHSGAGYIPHVTPKNGSGLHRGEVYHIERLTLLRGHPRLAVKAIADFDLLGNR